MANNPKGLGKGLAALLGEDVIDSQEEKSSLFLPISQVESCASQPRKQFDPDHHRGRRSKGHGTGHD